MVCLVPPFKSGNDIFPKALQDTPTILNTIPDLPSGVIPDQVQIAQLESSPCSLLFDDVETRDIMGVKGLLLILCRSFEHK